MLILLSVWPAQLVPLNAHILEVDKSQLTQSFQDTHGIATTKFALKLAQLLHIFHLLQVALLAQAIPMMQSTDYAINAHLSNITTQIKHNAWVAHLNLLAADTLMESLLFADVLQDTLLTQWTKSVTNVTQVPTGQHQLVLATPAQVDHHAVP